MLLEVEIQKTINRLVKFHDTRDPIKIAKEKGIIILYEELGSILGYYSKMNRIKFIHINQNLSFANQVFTCGHELGHAILHPDENTPKLSNVTISSELKIEKEANFFATRLMIDGTHFEKNVVSKYDILNYYGLPLEMERYIH